MGFSCIICFDILNGNFELNNTLKKTLTEKSFFHIQFRYNKFFFANVSRHKNNKMRI